MSIGTGAHAYRVCIRGAKAKAWCLLMHTEACLSLPHVYWSAAVVCR